MKKYILPFMSIAMLMAMASCSSSDDAVAENNVESKLVQMTFTATQESNVSTRTALTSEKKVIWKSGDAISVFDNYGSGHNHEFTLKGNGGSILGNFTGTAESTPTTSDSRYFAVYPSTSGAELNIYPEQNDYVSGITLPSKQTAIKGSFDPKAALMIAKSSDQNQLNFINVVSLVKVTTDFACKRIVLNANENIAGKGNIYYNSGEPYIKFTSEQSTSIVLKPATEGGDIEAGTYYIAVKPGTLSTGWSISFTSTDYNVYTRVANGEVTFTRGNMLSIGSFSTSGTWNSTSRGIKVNASQEVDLGLTITKEDGKKYRVIFANANLKNTGLAESETDYGDYFAWGATTSWYNNIISTSPSVTVDSWKEDKSRGYVIDNAPYYNSSTSSFYEYTSLGSTLAPEDDAARVILGGDWQIPSKEIWETLYENRQGINFQWEWETDTMDGTVGYKVKSKSDGTKSIFLPAAGYFGAKECSYSGVNGLYWTNAAYSTPNAYLLYFGSESANPVSTYGRFYGRSVRPVRLVEVD